MARQDIVEGPMKTKYTHLTTLLAAAGGKFLTGDKPAYVE